MHYYQFNIGDYASHTSRLSPMEDLAYRRLIDLYYLNEQPLNGCSTDVAREVGLVEHVDSVAYVLSKFFTKEENTFKQKRIDLEIKKYKCNHKNKSKAGKASAKARKDKALSVATGVEQVLNTTSTDEQLNINHKPITNNQEPLTKEKKKTMPAKASDSVNEIFNHWKEVMQKSDASKLTKERLTKVSQRLKDGYTVDQIKMAIDGCAMTPHNMGQNDNGKRYDDLELICRTGGGLERFANNTATQPQVSKITQKNLQNTMGDW